MGSRVLLGMGRRVSGATLGFRTLKSCEIEK
jgi:hypothetical protein